MNNPAQWRAGNKAATRAAQVLRQWLNEKVVDLPDDWNWDDVPVITTAIHELERLSTAASGVMHEHIEESLHLASEETVDEPPDELQDSASDELHEAVLVFGREAAIEIGRLRDVTASLRDEMARLWTAMLTATDDLHRARREDDDDD